MTANHYRAIVTARHRCEVNEYAWIGAPLTNLRPKRQRRWWRFGR
jgi:hypothetical protein